MEPLTSQWPLNLFFNICKISALRDIFQEKAGCLPSVRAEEKRSVSLRGEKKLKYILFFRVKIILHSHFDRRKRRCEEAVGKMKNDQDNLTILKNEISES